MATGVVSPGRRGAGGPLGFNAVQVFGLCGCNLAPAPGKGQLGNLYPLFFVMNFQQKSVFEKRAHHRPLHRSHAGRAL
jgi:hypothetical protein